MTPREYETLEIILRHVGSFNGRVVNGAKFERIVLLQRPGVTQAGDLLITATEFRPTGAKRA